MIAAEPALAVELSAAQLDNALAATANFVDLKSPFTLGHSVAVADLAAEAGHRLGLPREEVLMLRRAGLVHGFGRLGVSNSIWDRPGPLTALLDSPAALSWPGPCPGWHPGLAETDERALVHAGPAPGDTFHAW